MSLIMPGARTICFKVVEAETSIFPMRLTKLSSSLAENFTGSGWCFLARGAPKLCRSPVPKVAPNSAPLCGFGTPLCIGSLAADIAILSGLPPESSLDPSTYRSNMSPRISYVPLPIVSRRSPLISPGSYAVDYRSFRSNSMAARSCLVFTPTPYGSSGSSVS